MVLTRQIRKSFFRDPELWFLVLYNLLIFYLYFFEGIDPKIVIWGYYLQSLFIGLQFVSISVAKIYKSQGGLRPFSSYAFVLFFIVHFGLFHVVYFVFLVGMALDGSVEEIASLVKYLKLTAGFLLVNSAVLFGRELILEAPNYHKPSVIAAYLRILPIHLFIIFRQLR